jgi:hypothetical protein
MKDSVRLAVLSFIVLVWYGCGGEFHTPWREQKLPSGKSVKITSLQIAWGVEHDEPRSPDRDCFVLQFVYTAPDANDDAHEQEAKEVFELIRPASELWGFTMGELMAYSTIEPGRHYDLFLFQRSSDGKWSSKLEHH